MKKDKKQECPPCRKTSIGGQALIEGIMMRGPKQSAMAVRNPEGEIVLEKWDNKQSNLPKVAKLPVIRGVFNFIDAMVQGYKCLMRSAEISGLEELEAEIEREKQEKKRAKEAKKAEKKGITSENAEVKASESENAVIEEHGEDSVKECVSDEAESSSYTETSEKKTAKKKESSSVTDTVMVVAMVLAVALMLLLFIYLPNFVSTLVLGKNAATEHPILLSVISGFIKIAILIGYMSAVSLMNDIKRTFMYHGAEHKTIFCYEQGLELTVENVRKQKRFHPRCGTSFLFLMMFVGIMVMIPISYLLKSILPDAIIGSRPLYILVRSGVTLVLMPLIMGLGYELIKLAGRKDNLFVRIISAPGLWMQRITTKEPDDSMIECAIASIKEVIPEDGSDRL